MNGKKYHDYNWLYKKYVEEKLTSTEIGDIVKVHKDTILYQLKKNGIPRRKENVSSKAIDKSYKNPDWLIMKHHEEMLSLHEMAKDANVTVGTISYHMKKLEIPYRDRLESLILVGEQGKRNYYNGIKGKEHPWYGKSPTEEQKKKTVRAIRDKWKGYKTLHNMGYLSIRHPDDLHLILEHRYVVEEHIGRELLSTEDVHHIDQDKQNNDIDNLFLFRSRADHMYFHKMENLGRYVEMQYKYEHLTKRRERI